METSVFGQLLETAAALALGAVAGLFYDALRVIRKQLPFKLVTLLCDLVFSVAAGCAIFVLGMTIGGGRQRALTAVLTVLGGVLYFLTLTRPTTYILEGIADLISLLMQLLSYPVALLLKTAKNFAVFSKKVFNYGLGWYIFRERRALSCRGAYAKKSRRKESSVKKAGIIPKLLVFALIAFLAWTIFGLRGDIAKATARRNELKIQAAAVEVENDEMRRRLENRTSDEIIEEIAREELGLVMPGEQVYYD